MENGFVCKIATCQQVGCQNLNESKNDKMKNLLIQNIDFG